MESILEILKLGLPGLVFLLAMLSYKLLAKEQNQPQRDPNVLRLIKQFMYINVFLAMLTGAAPVVEYYYFPNGKVLNLEANISTAASQRGVAAVCHNVQYANRYLLVKDNATGNLIQVFAGSVVPCTGEQTLMLNADDANNLGWNGEHSREVEVVSAMPGFKFII